MQTSLVYRPKPTYRTLLSRGFASGVSFDSLDLLTFVEKILPNFPLLMQFGLEVGGVGVFRNIPFSLLRCF